MVAQEIKFIIGKAHTYGIANISVKQESEIKEVINMRRIEQVCLEEAEKLFMWAYKLPLLS